MEKLYPPCRPPEIMMAQAGGISKDTFSDATLLVLMILRHFPLRMEIFYTTRKLLSIDI
jgi:hypothetical protein